MCIYTDCTTFTPGLRWQVFEMVEKSILKMKIFDFVPLLIPLPLIHSVAPVCRPYQKTTYGVARNELLQVVCDVDSDPTNITFKWLFNDSHDSTSIRTYTSNGTRSVASYAPSSPRNYGKMICMAENQIGRQKDPCIFNIIPASK